MPDSRGLANRLPLARSCARSINCTAQAHRARRVTSQVRRGYPYCVCAHWISVAPGWMVCLPCHYHVYQWVPLSDEMDRHIIRHVLTHSCMEIYRCRRRRPRYLRLAT